MPTVTSPFSPTPTDAWLDRLRTELKGRAVEELHHELEGLGSFAPFYRTDDRPTQYAELLARLRTTNDWLISERLDATSPDANQTLIEALGFGLQAPEIELSETFDPYFFLKGVYLEYVDFVFTGSAITTDRLHQLDLYFTSRPADRSKISGDLRLTQPELRGQLPLFHDIYINGRECYRPGREVLYELQAFYRLLEAALPEGTESPESVAQQVTATITIGPSYFVNVAKVRALHVLWAHLQHERGCQRILPLRLHAYTAEQGYTEDVNDNYIRATPMALAAVQGGVSLLTVTPADVHEHPFGTDKTRRIARNIQHLLKEESFLHHVVDPTAGSYYVEVLTARLVEAVV